MPGRSRSFGTLGDLSGRILSGACLTLALCLAASVWLRDSSERRPELPYTIVHAQPPVSSHEQPPKQTHFDLDDSSGGLEFRGHVERIDLDEEYEIRAHLTITLRPTRRQGEPPVIKPRECHLVATRFREDRPLDVLHRDTRPIVVFLEQDGDTQSLPDLTFRLPKSIWAQASHVGLELRDGHVAWPVSLELAPRQPSAILFSLGRNSEALTLTSADDGVLFDIDDDGDLDQVAWTEAGTSLAFLALDVDGDGRITSGRELFGSAMVPGAGNGPNALMRTFKATGEPPSGSVHAGHELYERLMLWTDSNHNGVTDPGELRQARDFFTGIGMGFTKSQRPDEHGNLLRFEGWAQRRTEGPDQPLTHNQRAFTERQRPYYEVVFAVR